MSRFLTQNRSLVILPVALIFLAVNVTFISIPNPQPYVDIVAQEGWGNDALRNSLSSLYGGVDYPPLYMYALYFNAWLNHHLTNDSGPGTFPYMFISRMIPVLCDLLIGCVLFFALRKWGLKSAVVGASLYIFNPAIMYDTSYWGQVDSVYTLFLLLSLQSLEGKKYFLSTLYASVAVLTKLQAFFFVPILAIVLISNLRVKRILGIVLGDVIFVTAIMFPFIGVVGNIASNMFSNFGQYPYVTMNALNPWFLLFSYAIPVFKQCMRDTNMVYGISFRMVGYLAFAAYTGLVMYQIRKDERNLLLGSASIAFASFMLPTEIHERYLFPFFPLFLLIALRKREHIGVYTILTITYLLNLMLASPFGGFYSIFYFVQEALTAIGRFALLGNSPRIIAAINTFVFVYFSATGIFSQLIKNGRHLLLLGRRIVQNLQKVK